MIKAIIIDDEEKSIETLKLLIRNYHEDVQIIGEALDATEGLRLINEREFDLLFLDIQMPGKDGFGLLRDLKRISFKIIFITAYDKYAIHAIRFSALDYLLKPIDNRELAIAIKKAKSSKEKELSILSLNKFKEGLDENSIFNKIAIPTLNEIIFVPINKIYYLRSDNNYTLINIESEHPFLSSRNIGYYEELLTPYFFYRAHNSSLVNLNKVRRYVKGKGGYLELENGTIIEVSGRRKDGLLKILGLT